MHFRLLPLELTCSGLLRVEDNIPVGFAACRHLGRGLAVIVAGSLVAAVIVVVIC